MLSDLPADVLLNIVSFLLGEPDYLKLKYNNALQENTKEISIKDIWETIYRLCIRSNTLLEIQHCPT